jgi:short-subunit dehydrogenase
MTEESAPGRFALVTGASGGIGEALVDLLAAEGYEIMIVARNADQLNRVAGLATARYEAHVIPITLDLSRHDAGDIIAREMAARGFSPDVVINNAGFGKLGKAHEIARIDQVNMVDLNVRCLTDLTLRFLPDMLARGRGGVLNVASLAGFMPGPYMATYYASKNYAITFSKALAAELKGTGVSVSALCPGPVLTGFQARAGMENSWLNKIMRPMPIEAVAEAGWEGFKRGERVIVPGTMNKIVTPLTRLVPDTLLLPAIAFIQKPRPPRKKRGEA